ncbi:MAG TPA: glycosyltransferase family 2 protein [Verrucomicrobiae bacterium]|nr:glycosyltransferase family 2 protein [Verrucomicrobiae bacterium]
MDENSTRPVDRGRPDISIVIPVYNEDQTIEAVLRVILAVPFGGYRQEVVIVDDGSSDKTAEVLERFHNTQNLRILRRKVNRGKGSAVRDGIAVATGRAIIIQDADLEYDPSQIPMLAKPILEGEAKVVYGSRFRGVIRNMSPVRRFANWFLTSYINLLFGASITDACTCYKTLDSEVIQSFDLKSDGFEVCHEITAQVLRRGLAIKELPISYSARSADQGVKSSWRDLVKQIGYILRFRFCQFNSADKPKSVGA